QVERQAFLGAVGPYEVRRQSLDRAVVAASGVAAAGPLDLDDPGPELGELPRGERAGDDLLERDDGDSVQRPHEKARCIPDSGRPRISVLQVSPGATGCASVRVPVLITSPAASGRAVGCSESSRTR